MVQNRELHGKTVLITGATDGIGKELARMTWQAGANLILHGRNPQKLEALLQDLGSGLSGQRASTVKADFSNLQVVRDMAAQVLEEVPQLDVLVNNAGFYPSRRNVTYLSPFLLTHLLRPLLITSAPMRIVNLSSIGHRFVWSTPNPSSRNLFYWRWVAYCRSKLEIIPWTRTLSEQLQQYGISVNCVHPGIIRTKVIRFLPVSWGASVHSGAATVYRLVADPDLADVTGQYFERYRIAKPSPMAQSRRYQESLWRHTMRRLNLQQADDGSKNLLQVSQNDR